MLAICVVNMFGGFSWNSQKVLVVGGYSIYSFVMSNCDNIGGIMLGPNTQQNLDKYVEHRRADGNKFVSNLFFLNLDIMS